MPKRSFEGFEGRCKSDRGTIGVLLGVERIVRESRKWVRGGRRNQRRGEFDKLR